MDKATLKFREDCMHENRKTGDKVCVKVFEYDISREPLSVLVGTLTHGGGGWWHITSGLNRISFSMDMIQDYVVVEDAPDYIEVCYS